MYILNDLLMKQGALCNQNHLTVVLHLLLQRRFRSLSRYRRFNIRDILMQVVDLNYLVYSKIPVPKHHPRIDILPPLKRWILLSHMQLSMLSPHLLMLDEYRLV